MICFCQCARDHTWDDPTAEAYCLCGRILEGMTIAEHAEAVARHEATGKRMLEVNTLKPFIQLQ